MDNSVNHDKPEGLLGSLKDVSLKAAGYAYLVGDAALFAAGLMEKNLRGASVGALWGVGGLAAARYGNPNAEKQLELLSSRLGEYLHKQGVEIPQDPNTALLTRPQGILHHAERFLYDHPSEMLNAVYALGATQLIASGVGKKFKPDIASGALIAAGALAGLLITEKKPDANHPPQDALGKIGSWIQEKPLRVPAALYAVNNIPMVWAAFAKRKTEPAQLSYVARFATAAAYIFGNTMLFISSKVDNTDRHSQVMESLGQSAAHVIAAQPKEMQEAVLQHIAGYLAGQKTVPQSAEQIASMLHTELQRYGKAPDTWQDKIAAQPAAELTR